MRKIATVGFKWTALSGVGRQAISFGVFALLARMLRPDAFGLMTLAGVWIALMDPFINQGMSMAIVQRKTLEPEHLDAAFWSAMAFGICIAGVTTLLAVPLAKLMHHSELAPILKCLSLIFIGTAFSGVQTAILTRDLRFRELASRTLTAAGLGGVVGIGSALLGAGVWSLVTQQLASTTAGTIYLWRASDWRPRFHVSWRHLIELWRLSLTVLLSNLLVFISARSDQLILGRVLGSEALGLYAAARRLPTLIGEAMRGPLGSVTMPVLSRLQSDPVRLAKGIQAVLRLVAIVAFPIFTFLACTGTLIVTFLLGPTWTSIGFLVQLFAIAELIKTLVVFAYPTLMACGRARQCLVLQCAHACGTLIAASAGLRWGATGVGFGLVSNSCFIALTSLFMVSNVTPLRLKDYFAAVWRPFTLSIVMSSVVLGILFLFPANMSTAIQTLAVMVIAPITYLALLALFTPEDLNELQRTLRTALGPEISETLVRIAKRLTLRLS